MDKSNNVDKMYQDYAEGGLVSKNAMSDYFLASSGKMTEMEFVGKHKISTLNFENKFQADNNVDIAGIESFSEINDKPEGVNMDYSKKPQMMFEGGEVDPVSGNDIPPGVAPENVRDDVPAMLSEGEYVVPADVLKYYGVNFFEKLRNKAKEGMEELDSGGRIGGEKPEGKVEMAEGGVVEEPKGGSFKPSDWGTPGAGKTSYGFSADRKLGSSAYEYREYTGPAGDIIKVLFSNGTVMGSVPEGYMPIGQAAAAPVVAPVAATPQRSQEMPYDYADPLGSEDDNGGMGRRDPLGELDFSDSESVIGWAEERLAGGFDNKGVQVAGGAVAGPIGAGLAGAIAAARDIAVVNAAAMVAYENGNQTLGDQLKASADKRASKTGILSIAPETWYDGKGIFKNHNKTKTKTSVTKTSAEGEPETFNMRGVDYSSESSYDEDTDRTTTTSTRTGGDLTSSARPQGRPSSSRAPSQSSSGSSRSSSGVTSGTSDGNGGYTFDKGGLVARPKKQPK